MLEPIPHLREVALKNLDCRGNTPQDSRLFMEPFPLRIGCVTHLLDVWKQNTHRTLFGRPGAIPHRSIPCVEVSEEGRKRGAEIAANRQDRADASAEKKKNEGG